MNSTPPHDSKISIKQEANPPTGNSQWQEEPSNKNAKTDNEATALKSQEPQPQTASPNTATAGAAVHPRLRRKLAIVATPPLQNAEGSSAIDQTKIKEETLDEQKQAPPSTSPSVSPQSAAEKSQNTSSLADSPVKTNENNTGTEIVKPKGRPRGRPRKDSIVESTEKETTLESKKTGMTGEKFVILKGGKPIQSGQVIETGRNQGLQETKEKEQSKETTKEEKEDEDKEKGEKDEITDNTTVTENATKSAPRGRGRPRGRPRKNSGGRGRGGGRGEVLQKQQEEMQKESTEKKEQHDDIKPSLQDEKTQKETAENETSTNDETENKQPKENFQTELRESNTESMDLETDQAEESTKAHLDANGSVAMEEAETEPNGDSKRRKRKRTELDRLLSPSDFSLGRSTSTRRTFTSVIAGLTKTEEEKRRIIQEMDAQERERKQLEKKKHQPIIDTQIAPNETLVLFHRRSFNRSLRDYLPDHPKHN